MNNLKDLSFLTESLKLNKCFNLLLNLESYEKRALSAINCPLIFSLLLGKTLKISFSLKCTYTLEPVLSEISIVSFTRNSHGLAL